MAITDTLRVDRGLISILGSYFMKAKTRIVLNMLVGLCLLHGCAESSVDTEALCGNGVIDPGESCDKTNIGTATCQSVLGLSDATGKLGCNPDCSFDTSSCSVRQCLSQTTYCDESKVWHYCEAGMDRTKTCGSGENTNKPYCDDALGCLAAENSCKDGETACNSNQPQICSDGRWINNGPVCTFGCNVQTHRCNDQLVSCEDDDVQCNGDTVQTCVSGTWQDASSPCPFGCTGGVCNKENKVCDDDAIQCNGAFVETCQENTWVSASSPCPFGCSNGICNPENMTCRDGNKQCNGAIIQECSGNAWNNTITCTSGCRSGSCIHNCEATDKTCNGLQPQKCQVAETGNVYVDDGAACPFGCDASTGTCTSAKACSGLSGAVSHGTSGCVSATQYGTCNDGAWTGTKTCAAGCVSDACYETCLPGAYQCAGSEIQKCNASGSAWATQTTCSGDLPVCDDTSHKCVCEESAIRCFENNVEMCSDGVWKLIDACHANETCVATEDDGNCVPTAATSFSVNARTDICSVITSANSYSGTATVTFSDAPGVKLVVVANCPNQGTTVAERVYLDNTSSITVTGLSTLSKITIVAKASSKNYKLNVTLDDATTIYDSHAFASQNLETFSFDMTGEGAQGFKLTASAKSVQIQSIQWE